MQNRRNFLIQSSLAAGAITLLKPLKGFSFFEGTGSRPIDKNILTILYSANLKGQRSTINGLGGLNGIQDAVNEIKKKRTNVLLVDAGDNIKGTHNAEADEKYLSGLEKTGYDVILPGNRDMANGENYFADIVKHSNLKIVATNYYKQQALVGIALPYCVVKKGNLKIGIVGLGNTTKVKNIATLSLADNVKLVNKTAAQLKEQHQCSLVVCLTHEGFTQKNCRLADDISFAKMLSGVDVLISGSESESISNTHLVKTINGEEIMVSTTGYKGATLGRIDITFNDLNEKTNIAVKQVIISSEKNNMAALNKYASALSEA